MKETSDGEFTPVDISEQDVVEAMKRIAGYIDISPGDFREVYQTAYSLAIQRLFHNLTADKIMTQPAVVVDHEMSIVSAAQLLAEQGISGGPVVDQDGRVIGVVSEKDFLSEMGFGETPSFMQITTHCLNNKSCMIGKLHNKTVKDIMSRPPITGDSTMSIGDISTLFTQRKINRLPIVNTDERPIGIVTRTDLAQSFNTLQKSHQL